MKNLIFVMFLILSTNALSFDKIPPDHVRGSLCTVDHPDFDGLRYPEQIPHCRRNVKTSTKRQIYREAGVPRNQQRQYTIDHFLSLSISGTNHKDNLWAEHKNLKKHRGNLEYDNYIHLRAGDITRNDAIMILKDSKLDPFLLEKPSYDSHGGFWEYIRARGLSLEGGLNWVYYF